MSNQKSYNDRPGLESLKTPQKAGLRSMPRKGKSDRLFLDMYITQMMKERIKKEWSTLERQTRGLRLRTAHNATVIRKQAEELIKSGGELLGVALGKAKAPKLQKTEPRTAPLSGTGARVAKEQRPSEIFAKSKPFVKKKAGFKSMVWGQNPGQKSNIPEVVVEPKVQKREQKEFKSLGVDY